MSFRPVPHRLRPGRRAAAGSQYALILGLIGIVALLAVASAGQSVNRLLGRTSNTLQQVLGNSAGTAGDPVTATPAAPVAPGGLALAQTANSRDFQLSWTAGSGNGPCKLQFAGAGGVWTDIASAASLDCDAGQNATALTLNASGWKAAWGGTAVRLVRLSDAAVLGSFPQTLACVATFGSATAQPSFDANCNGNWDNVQQTNVDRIIGTSGQPYRVTIGAASYYPDCQSTATVTAICRTVLGPAFTQAPYGTSYCVTPGQAGVSQAAYWNGSAFVVGTAVNWVQTYNWTNDNARHCVAPSLYE